MVWTLLFSFSSRAALTVNVSLSFKERIYCKVKSIQKFCPAHGFNGCCHQVCMMPQNVTSYGAARSSVHHHTIWASHHKPRSTSWLDGVIAAGCQATTTCSTDVTPLRPSLTASLPHPPNGMTLPVDEVKGAKPAGSVSINDATGLDSVTKHYKVNQRCPRRHLKKNRTIRRRQNTKQEMR